MVRTGAGIFVLAVLLLGGCAAPTASQAPVELFCTPANFTEERLGIQVRGFMCRTPLETSKAIEQQLKEDQLKPQKHDWVPGPSKKDAI